MVRTLVRGHSARHRGVFGLTRETWLVTSRWRVALLGDRGCRFDVVEVLMDGDRVVHVELLQNAFVPPAEEEW